MKENRIADKINITEINFVKRTRGTRKVQAIVTFAPSAKTLFFNEKMVALLKMENWKAVVIGYEKTSQIIVLKETDPEEYGSVGVATPSPATGLNTKYNKRYQKCRKVTIKHLIESQNITPKPAYRAEREGMMIFLEEIE